MSINRIELVRFIKAKIDEIKGQTGGLFGEMNSGFEALGASLFDTETNWNALGASAIKTIN